jgi:fructokinase
VGAGDAFLAALLYGLYAERPGNELLPFANAAGAYVASSSGANPGYSIELLEQIVKTGTVLIE